jgi:hypothetical protein
VGLGDADVVDVDDDVPVLVLTKPCRTHHNGYSTVAPNEVVMRLGLLSLCEQPSHAYLLAVSDT